MERPSDHAEQDDTHPFNDTSKTHISAPPWCQPPHSRRTKNAERTSSLKRWSFVGLVLALSTAMLAGPAFAEDAWARANRTGVIKIGDDAEGGGPYVYLNPENPKELIGFEI